MDKKTGRDVQAELERLRRENERLQALLARPAAERLEDADRIQLDVLFASLPYLFFLMGADDTHLAFRAGRLSVPFVPPESFLGRRVHEVLPEPAASIIVEAMHRARATGQSSVVEYELPEREGSRWYQGNIVPLSGGRIGMVASDVTERRHREDALRESKERFQAIAEAMPISVVMTHETDGRVLYGNSRVAEMFEVPREQLTHQVAAQFYVHPEERDRLIATLRAVGSLSDAEVQMKTASGRAFWASFSAQRVRFEGQPALLSGILDISGRKSVEESLRTSEELYRVLFEGSPFPAWAVDIETYGFLAVNDAAIGHYGYSREEFMGMTARGLRVPEEVASFEAQVAEMKKHPAQRTYHTRHRKKGGGIIRVDVTVQPVQFHGRAAWVSTIHDITERLRLEEELQRAQKLESIGRLAGGVAHDFNNLLTAILGYTQILESRLSADQSAVEDLGEIRRAGLRARDLTQQLLAVARRQVSTPRIVDLNVLVTDMERLLRRVMNEDVELVTRLAPGLWPIKADPTQIEQVLMNLAVNARDAMPDGGTLTIDTSNRNASGGDAAVAGQGESVVLRVSDTGHGMSSEVLAHVFEPFFTTKPVGQGTGLGLATVYGTVHQSGGHIDVDSSPGQGTTFTVSFPRVDASPAPVPIEAGPDMTGGEETILVVEDNPAVRSLAVRVLRKAGYAVRAAASGVEAIEMLSKEPVPIDLLITDVVMPQMSGKEMANRLMQQRPGLQVLYVSGYPQSTVDHHGVLKASDEFLPKPFTGPQLLAKVRHVLDRASRA